MGDDECELFMSVEAKQEDFELEQREERMWERITQNIRATVRNLMQGSRNVMRRGEFQLWFGRRKGGADYSLGWLGKRRV